MGQSIGNEFRRGTLVAPSVRFVFPSERQTSKGQQIKRQGEQIHEERNEEHTLFQVTATYLLTYIFLRYTHKKEHTIDALYSRHRVETEENTFLWMDIYLYV